MLYSRSRQPLFILPESPHFIARECAMSSRSRLWFSLLVVVTVLVISTQGVIVTGAAPAPQILINEFMPRPSTGAEWVELFNPNPIDVDLSGWKVDDDTISPPQTTIGAGVIIPANSLLVVLLTTNILNDTGSDAVQLLDLTGNPGDIEPYSSATAGKSFARVPDASATWVKGTPSQGQWNVLPGPTPVPTYTPTPTSTPTDTPLPTNTPTNTSTPTS